MTLVISFSLSVCWYH